MIALVLSLIAASIRSARMLKVRSSMSTKTGVAPSSAILSAVAMKLNGVVITSSPGPISSAINASSRASVPLATETQWPTPT